jgi:tetratricopeptide (TPR) repeat protein
MADLVGQYAEWVDGKRGPIDLTAPDLDAVRRELSRLDPSVIAIDASVAPERAREIRRRVLTTFALEVAAVGSTRHAAPAGRLVEWACAYVRTHAPLNEFDGAWQLAALSVLEGAIDSHALAEHVSHARAVFPSEPRLLLARGIVEEQFNAPSEAYVRGETAASLQRAREAAVRAEGESYRASERALARFREAAADDALRAEALLRTGHVELRLSRFDAALATLKDLDRHTDDPALLYLASLFRGIAYEGRARLDEARQAYESALKISPNAHSATLRLAAMGFRYGHGTDSPTLLESLLRDSDPRRDPWWSYYAADWRFYYPRIARVRAFVRMR